MWQTQIMESMKLLLDKYPKDSKEIIYQLSLKLSYESIPTLQTFYFGDVEDLGSPNFEEEQPIFGYNIESNKFPYKYCLFEGDNFNTGDNLREHEFAAKKRAVAIITNNKNFAQLLFFSRVDYDPNHPDLKDDHLIFMNNMWGLDPITIFLRINIEGTREEQIEDLDNITSLKDILKGGVPPLQLSRDKLEAICDTPIGGCIPAPLLLSTLNNPSAIETLMKEINPELCFVKNALLLLNCKNVSTETVQPSVKLNKKRTKNNKLPFYSYKILKVTLPRTRQEIIIGKKGEGIPQRLHHCRGHIKHYTAEKPLFGKYVGNWFWHDFKRGSKELGSIEKEYEIKNASK